MAEPSHAVDLFEGLNLPCRFRCQVNEAFVEALFHVLQGVMEYNPRFAESGGRLHENVCAL